MASVMIKCPKTGKEVRTGIGVAQKEFFETASFIECPHCGERHTWEKKDAWIKE